MNPHHDIESNAFNDVQTVNDEMIVTSSSRVRWIILVLSCVIMIGYSYVYQMPAAVYQQMKDLMPPENFETNFNLLFTAVAISGIVSSFFAGVMVKRYGDRKCLVLSVLICLIGSIIITIGVQYTSWTLMLIGRAVNGVGSEFCIVVNQIFLTKWFPEKELGIALGINTSVRTFATVVSNIISPKVANVAGVSYAFSLNVAVYALSFVSTTLAFLTDRSAEVKSRVVMPTFENKNKSSDLDERNSRQSNGDETENKIIVFDLNFKKTFWLLCACTILPLSINWSFMNVSAGILLERDLFMKTPSDCVLKYPDQCSSGYLAPAEGNPSRDSDGNECPSNGYAPVLPSSINMTDESLSQYVKNSLESSQIDCSDVFWSEGCTMNYCQKKNEATEKAGVLMSIPAIMTVLMALIVGVVVDKTGLRAELICLSAIMMVCAHAMLAFSTVSPIIPLLCHGLGFVFALVTVWASVRFTVDEKDLDTAVSILASLANIGLAIFPLIVAKLYESAKGQYVPSVELFFIAGSCLFLFYGIVLKFADRQSGGRMGAVS